MLKIALGQIEVTPGQPKKNFERISKFIEQAKKDQVDLIIFPELCISGYLLSDLFYNEAYVKEAYLYNEKIKEYSKDIGIIWGNVHFGPVASITKGRDGRTLRTNTAFFAYNGEYLKRNEEDLYPGMYIKHLYPDYRFFDDSRYFMSISEMALSEPNIIKDLGTPFVFKGHTIGLEICEDLFSDDYALNLTNHYQNNCDYIINLSCSPYTIGKEEVRLKQIKKHYETESKASFIYVNSVGVQNNGKNILTFDGNSSYYSNNGEYLDGCNDSFKEEYKVIDFTKPVLSENKLLESLLFAIRKFDEQMFGSSVKWIIGLSGGLDSSVSCALLSLALGSERIRAYNMATSYNSLETKDNARNLANALDITLREGVIEPVVVQLKDCLETEYKYEEHQISSFVMENVQARTRGHLLASFAAIEGGVIVNNGNKVEVALGYCTLYGDSIGALSLLADLTKVQLFTLSREINEVLGKEVIPERLLPTVVEGKIEWEMPPSAELKDAQVDPMKWFYHDTLIDLFTQYPNFQIVAFMKQYLDGSIYETELGNWIKYYGLDDSKAFIEDLEWILKQIRLSVYKRIQMPPIVTISQGSFGFDYRESQINYEQGSEYEELKTMILNM